VVTELTEPTDRRPVMKRLSRTTVSCGTLPLSRHGLVISGAPRESGYRVVDWT